MSIKTIALFLILPLAFAACTVNESINSKIPTVSQEIDTQLITAADEFINETEITVETEKTEDTMTNTLKLSMPEFDGNYSTVLSDFSNEIYLRVEENNSDKENIIFSPLSVMYALALASNGAEDQTKAEFEYLFGGATVDEMNEYLLALTKSLEADKDSKVVVGNSIWANKNLFTFSHEYISTTNRYYSAEARSVVFNDDAVNEINKWVSEKTDGLINKVVDSLTPDLAVILFNTVLFDGKWENEYKNYDVSDGEFFNYDGSTQEVKYLYSKEYGTYFEVDGGVGFSKAYKDGYSFTAVLPTGDIDSFIKNCDINEILTASKSSTENVKAYIPKFEYDYTITLKNILTDMGLTTAFSYSADFDKMAEGGNANIFISQVFQKAKIILDEHGTKAAAVTGIPMATTSIQIQKDKIIRLEKPFLYIIQDSDGNPLFIGTVYNLG